MSQQHPISRDGRASYLISSKESRRAGKPVKKKKGQKGKSTKKSKGKGRGR